MGQVTARVGERWANRSLLINKRAGAPEVLENGFLLFSQRSERLPPHHCLFVTHWCGRPRWWRHVALVSPGAIIRVVMLRRSTLSSPHLLHHCHKNIDIIIANAIIIINIIIISSNDCQHETIWRKFLCTDYQGGCASSSPNLRHNKLTPKYFQTGKRHQQVYRICRCTFDHLCHHHLPICIFIIGRC